MPKKKLELLTESMFYVLMAFSKGEMCGTEISEFIEKVTNKRIMIGPATLYTVLAKFEKEKYIKEVAVDGRKRTYIITKKGMEAYNEELRRLEACIFDAKNIGGYYGE